MNAIVTGATKGIGRAVAIKLAEAGYNLAICSRNGTELEELTQSLRYTEVKVLAVKADLSVKQECVNFCNAVRNEMPDADVLVNNAGLFLTGSVLDEADDQFERMLDLNLKSAYYCSKFFGKIMRERRFGHIFNICSVASKKIAENAGSYSVTKAAMFSLNSVFREELSKYNVKVTAVLPGATLTSSWEGTNIPSDHFVQAEDIAKSITSILCLSAGANVEEITINPVHF
ncbi:SDR family oxidoreductase [Pedobacter sp. PWIIR3]